MTSYQVYYTYTINGSTTVGQSDFGSAGPLQVQNFTTYGNNSTANKTNFGFGTNPNTVNDSTYINPDYTITDQDTLIPTTLTISTYPTFTSTFTAPGYSLAGTAIVPATLTVSNITTSPTSFGIITQFALAVTNTGVFTYPGIGGPDYLNATVYLLAPGEIYGELTTTGIGYLSNFATFHTTDFTANPAFTTYSLVGETYSRAPGPSTSTVTSTQHTFLSYSYHGITSFNSFTTSAYYPLNSSGFTTVSFQVSQNVTKTSSSNYTSTNTVTALAAGNSSASTFSSYFYVDTTSVGIIPRSSHYTITGGSFNIPFYTEKNSTNPLFGIITETSTFSGQMLGYSGTYMHRASELISSKGYYFSVYLVGGLNSSSSFGGGAFSTVGGGITNTLMAMHEFNFVTTNNALYHYFSSPSVCLPYNQYGFRLTKSGPLYSGLSLGTFTNIPSFFLSYCATNTSEFTPAIFENQIAWVDGISSYSAIYSSYSVTISNITNITQVTTSTYSAAWGGLGSPLTDALSYIDPGITFVNTSVYSLYPQIGITRGIFPVINGVCGIGYPASLTANSALYLVPQGAFNNGTTSTYYPHCNTFSTTGPFTLSYDSWDLVQIIDSGNSTIVNPSGVFPVFDGTQYYNPFNQGNIT